MTADWPQLLAIAEAEVRRTLRRLPGPVRDLARALPVTYEPRPDEDAALDGYDPDLLGLFVGTPHGEDLSGAVDLPPQIILYLDNLWDFSDSDEPTYREELRTTFLHELGHYLGLDEIDLEERGLE
jgi:predicted Zn-dependent protease with MMP-like domain